MKGLIRVVVLTIAVLVMATRVHAQIVVTPTAAAFSLIMLTNTDSGDAYTFSEYEKMFRNTGFATSTLHPVPGMPQQVIVSEK